MERQAMALAKQLINRLAAVDDLERAADGADVFFLRIDLERLADRAEQIGCAHRVVLDRRAVFGRCANHLSRRQKMLQVSGMAWESVYLMLSFAQ